MNVRQQLYKKFLVQGMSKYAAARSAGYSHSMAIQAKNIEKRINMPEWLEMEGLTDKALANHAKQGLEAMKTISAIGDADGKSTDFVDVPDWQVRHKYFETILKLRNKLKPEGYIDQSKHFHLTMQQLTKELNGTNGRLQKGAPNSIPRAGIVLAESIRQQSLDEAIGNHDVSTGQSENVSPIG